MRLLYITPFIEGAGGVQRVLAIKANYFIEKFNYEVHILVTNGAIDKQHYQFNASTRFYSEIASGKGLVYLYNYASILKKYSTKIKPDIIVVCDNGYKGYLVPFLISKKHKVIFECHGTTFHPKNRQNAFTNYFSRRLKSTFFNICAVRFSKFVVLLEDFKNEFKTKNLIVIPNPIWITAKKVPNYSAKKVIAVGRHSHEKGFDRMLSIWQKVVEKHPNWLLEIYGEADPEIDLELLANSLGISENVKFFDPVSNIEDKYLEASFLILTSRFEGFGMVLIEAMTSGLPCISFDCNRGPRDIITNNYDGFLIENGNQDRFVTAIDSLIEDEALRIEMGENAKLASEKYDIDKIMVQWKNLFKSLNLER
jgi:glycosyltransferase involved in cell wall biosynthesis